MFVPSNAFGMIWKIVWLMLLENRNFCVKFWNFYFLLEHKNLLNVLHNIDIWISHVFLIFQNFWSYISLTLIQIFTDCSVLDRFCFCCIVCLFWWIYGSYRGVWVMEKLEYSIIMPILNMNQFITVPKVKDLFVILTDLTKVLLSFVWLKFSSFGWDHDGWRNKEWQEPKLGDAQGTPS